MGESLELPERWFSDSAKYNTFQNYVSLFDVDTFPVVNDRMFASIVQR